MRSEIQPAPVAPSALSPDIKPKISAAVCGLMPSSTAMGTKCTASMNVVDPQMKYEKLICQMGSVRNA